MYQANLILLILIGLLCSNTACTSTIPSIAITEKSFECGKNEEWMSCIECQHTCYSVLNAWGEYKFCYKPKPEDFREHCTMECRCKTGYLRDLSGECIRPSQCHPVFSANYRRDF